MDASDWKALGSAQYVTKIQIMGALEKIKPFHVYSPRNGQSTLVILKSEEKKLETKSTTGDNGDITQ